MNSFELSSIDIGIMLLYAVFIIGYGLYHAKRSDSEDYFLGGRSMTWPIVGIALFAANISSSTLVGLAGDAYKTNAHVYNYEWFAVVILIFFAIFFLPFYLRSKVYTMPEFLERRYDRRSRYYFSFITIVGNVLIDTAAGLYVGNIVLKLIFPELPSWVIITMLAFAAAAYTIPGGLNSVIQTEVIQALLLIAGSIFLTYFAFQNVGGWDAMITGLNEKHAAGEIPKDAWETLSLVRSSDDEFMPWYGLLTGVPLLGFYFWANNQFMVQRVLSAKDLNHGRWGALFAGLLKLPVFFIMVLPGVLAILMFSDLDLTGINYILPSGEACANLRECPNLTYPVLLFNLLPTGILGLVVAGLLAAMMSSISATFNSASTLITMDFVKQLRPNISEKQLVRSGQIATLILVVLASIWVPFIESVSDTLWEYLQRVLGYIAPPVVSTFLLGLFWKRANSTGSIVSLLFGFVIAITLLFVDTGLHFLLLAFVLLIICMVVHILVSLLSTPPAEDQVEHYTWNPSMFKAETEELRDLPWYQNYRYLAIILLIITAIIVGIFW
jgi:SSS family solute:Na+ symporter